MKTNSSIQPFVSLSVPNRESYWILLFWWWVNRFERLVIGYYNDKISSVSSIITNQTNHVQQLYMSPQNKYTLRTVLSLSSHDDKSSYTHYTTQILKSWTNKVNESCSITSQQLPSFCYHDYHSLSSSLFQSYLDIYSIPISLQLYESIFHTVKQLNGKNKGNQPLLFSHPCSSQKNDLVGISSIKFIVSQNVFHSYKPPIQFILPEYDFVWYFVIIIDYIWKMSLFWICMVEQLVQIQLQLVMNQFCLIRWVYMRRNHDNDDDGYISLFCCCSIVYWDILNAI